MSDVPPHAWHTLGTDLFYWNKIDYLVIRDYFSKYLIIRRLPNSSSHAVIKELGLVFTELGRPFVLRSDNGPCYSSREFHNFLSFYQVDHITSSPHHPQSNGFAEALVGITKKLMEKSERGKTVELWSFTVQDHSNLINSPISIRDVDRKKATLKPSSNSIQYRTQHGHLQDSQGIAEETTYRYFPQEPQNWSLDNQFLSRKCMEMFGEQPLLTNQQLSQIPTGSGFQTTPS